MHKIFLSVVSMIFTSFLMKSYKKLREKPETKEEIYRSMRDAREQWLREHQPKRPVAEVDAHLMRGNPSAALASIGTVSELEEALRPKRAVDGCDAMAMAPRRFS